MARYGREHNSSAMRQAALPLEILSAPLGHFTAHVIQRLWIEDLFRERENLVVFHGDVAFVDGTKLVKVAEQARGFVSRELADGEPLLAKLFDSIVTALRGFVIGFQCLNFGQGFAS